jgi:hypothetical protein
MSDEVKGLLNKPKGLLDEYLTEDEEAEELKKTVRTLRRWRKMRMGPAYTHNGTPRRDAVAFGLAVVRMLGP